MDRYLDYLHHYCDYCNKIIEGDVFVNIINNHVYHFHLECFKLEMQNLKKGERK